MLGPTIITPPGSGGGEAPDLGPITTRVEALETADVNHAGDVQAVETRVLALEDAPAAWRYVRQHLGSQQLTASGTWTKADALALYPTATEVDIEFVDGGNPGTCAWLRNRLLSDIASSVDYLIGAGGIGLTSSSPLAHSVGRKGGTTSFGTLVQALGGFSPGGGLERALAAEFWPSLGPSGRATWFARKCPVWHQLLGLRCGPQPWPRTRWRRRD